MKKNKRNSNHEKNLQDLLDDHRLMCQSKKGKKIRKKLIEIKTHGETEEREKEEREKEREERERREEKERKPEIFENDLSVFSQKNDKQ